MNTLHGVRHSPLSSPSSIFLGRTPRITSSLCRPYPISVLAPLVRWVGPFLLRSGPNIDSSFPVCPLPFFCSLGSSWPLVHPVHRRGDLADTLVLLVLLLAPPIFCPHPIVPPSGPAHCAFQLLCLCCPPPPCLSCASLNVLPCGARVIVLSLCSCGLAVFSWFLRSSLVLVRALLFPVLSAPSVVFRFVLSASLAPRVVLCAPWSSLHPGVLVPPLGICCICGGPVALLHAWSVVKLQWDERQRWLRNTAIRCLAFEAQT